MIADERSNYDCLVIGAGAAGMLAAATAAERGRTTLLVEKNIRPGVKILMSGGTRCNLTQNTNTRGIIEAYGDQGKFLHSALAGFSPQDLVRLIEAEGVPTKIEETNKIFPVSDRAQDIVDALVRLLNRCGALLSLGEPVTAATKQEDHFVVTTSSRTLSCSSLITTTGGLSYPGSGTTGDGFKFAEAFGHSLVPTRPALTPLTTDEDWVRELSGLTLPDVAIWVAPLPEFAAEPVPPLTLRKLKGSKRNVLAEQRGSLLFTHFGLSGPTALDVSRAVTSHPQPRQLALLIDFLPDLSLEETEAQFRAECAGDGKKQVVGVLSRFVPRRLAEALLKRWQIPLDKRAAEISKQDRNRLIESLKRASIRLSGAMGYRKAEVTAGGVSLSEVDSKTMQSKLVPGLFFAGEVLDLDGPIGGYNFQAAFATGRLAGLHA